MLVKEMRYGSVRRIENIAQIPEPFGGHTLWAGVLPVVLALMLPPCSNSAARNPREVKRSEAVNHVCIRQVIRRQVSLDISAFF